MEHFQGLTAGLESPLFLPGEAGESLQARFEEYTVQVAAAGEAHVWIDAEPFGAQARIVAPLEKGRHKITLRVESRQGDGGKLKVVLFKPQGSDAEFTVVDGR